MYSSIVYSIYNLCVLVSHYRALPEALAIEIVVVLVHIHRLIVGLVALHDEDVVDGLPTVDLIFEGDLVRQFIEDIGSLQNLIPKAIHALVRLHLLQVLGVIGVACSHG